jgi:group I intron endonuclease
MFCFSSINLIPKSSGIYCIAHLPTCRRYVGSSCDMRARLRGHIAKLKKGKHHNTKLQNVFDKHGPDGFAVCVLELTDGDCLFNREQWHINHAKPWFNLAPASRSVLGIKRSNKTKNKMSEAQKERYKKYRSPNLGRIVPTEERIKVSIAKKGKKRPDLSERNRARVVSSETKKKISASLMGQPGRPHSEESKKKIADAIRGIKRSQSTKDKISESWINRRRCSVSNQPLLFQEVSNG